MKKTLTKMTLALCIAMLSGIAWGNEINEQRAHFNYQFSCQGCHLPDGGSKAAVPQFRDQIGYFLEIDEGREYLVRVPGAATSALSDADLAEVLNWIIHQFGGASIAGGFTPYTTEEVASLRQDPLNEVVQHRAELLTEISRVLYGE